MLMIVSVCSLNIKVIVKFKLYFFTLNTFEKGNIVVKMNVGIFQLGTSPQILIISMYMMFKCTSSLKA